MAWMGANPDGFLYSTASFFRWGCLWITEVSVHYSIIRAVGCLVQAGSHVGFLHNTSTCLVEDYTIRSSKCTE